LRPDGRAENPPLPATTAHPAPRSTHPPPRARRASAPDLGPRPSCPLHLAPRTSHLAPRTWHLAPRTSHLAPRTSHLVPRTSYLVPRTSYLVPRTSHLLTSYLLLLTSFCLTISSNRPRTSGGGDEGCARSSPMPIEWSAAPWRTRCGAGRCGSRWRARCSACCSSRPSCTASAISAAGRRARRTSRR